MKASHLITCEYSKKNMFAGDVSCISILKDILRMRHFQVAIINIQNYVWLLAMCDTDVLLAMYYVWLHDLCIL